MFLVAAFAGMFTVYWFFSPQGSGFSSLAEAEAASQEDLFDPNAPIAPIAKSKQPRPVTQRVAQSPPPLNIGIIAGHRGFDSGTECSDGLTEVEITTILASGLQEKLTKAGIDSETLDEFDPKLENYSATALLSIHVDSCDFVNELATGYKISGSPFTDSSQFSICVQQAYGEITKLPYHENSITPHMADYHAFREIGLGTPALIIEVGFLNLDREILTDGSETIIDALESGIVCYLEQTR